MRDDLISLLWSVKCEGEEGFPYCNERRYGGCRSINKLIACQVGAIADHLIENGVTRIPCKIGDTVYAIRNHRGEKYPHKGVVSEMYFTSDMSLMIVVKNIERGQWGKEVFRTEEEAEKYLKKEASQNEK